MSIGRITSGIPGSTVTNDSGMDSYAVRSDRSVVVTKILRSGSLAFRPTTCFAVSTQPRSFITTPLPALKPVALCAITRHVTERRISHNSPLDFMTERYTSFAMVKRMRLILLFAAFCTVGAADYPPPTEGDYTIRNFKFASGETLPELRIHYRTLGKIDKDAQGKTRNAVLIMHGTTGSGAQFIRPEFAGELFGKDQPLDVTKFFIVLPDGIGHGKSSKPSDGLHAKFPHYGYIDMVLAQYRLLTDGLGVSHARLVMGTSMGGMHTWLWGESHPEFMDALLPLASF